MLFVVLHRMLSIPQVGVLIGFFLTGHMTRGSPTASIVLLYSMLILPGKLVLHSPSNISHSLEENTLMMVPTALLEKDSSCIPDTDAVRRCRGGSLLPTP